MSLYLRHRRVSHPSITSVTSPPENWRDIYKPRGQKFGYFDPLVPSFAREDLCIKMVIWLTPSPINCPRGLWMTPLKIGGSLLALMLNCQTKPFPHLRLFSQLHISARGERGFPRRVGIGNFL